MSELPEDLLRDAARQVLGALVRRGADFASAEDAVQEALLEATVRWPETGVPAEPAAWLTTVAKRKLVDAQRSDIARRQREQTVASEPEAGRPSPATTPCCCCSCAATLRSRRRRRCR